MLSLILTLAVIGFVTWLIVTYIPMPEPFGKVIIVIVVVLLIIYVLRVLGVGDIALPRL
jgi:hypothetical protein